MNDRNKIALFLIAFLFFALFIVAIAYPPIEKEPNEINSFGEIFFENTDYALYINHTIEFVESEEGDWYFNEDDIFLQSYRVITEFELICNSSIIDIVDNAITNDMYLILNISITVYDRNAEVYTVFDAPCVYENIDLSVLEYSLIDDGNFTRVYGEFTSQWFEPMEFEGNSYRVTYIFSSNYALFIDYNVVNEYEWFESDIYFLPFEFPLTYDTSKLIPHWWLYVSSVIGVFIIIMGILYTKKKKKFIRPSIA